MRRFSLFLVPFLSLCLVALAAGAQQPTQASNPPGPAPLALVGGTVVDLTAWGDSAKDTQNAIVVIREGRIAEVGSAGVKAA